MIIMIRMIKTRCYGGGIGLPPLLTLTILQGKHIMNTHKCSLIQTATIIVFAVFALSMAQSPVLKVRGRVNPDVYLQSLDVQVEVTGGIAFTRYTMVFKNKTDRVLEGKLTFPLPDGRSVTYYALDIDGKMREAVPVDKAKAAEVFEEIERRQVDPGLLERVEGNNFRTRIYPIPAKGTRTVAIGYEEELSIENGTTTPRSGSMTASPRTADTFLRYNLPMAYTDTLEKFSIRATVWKNDLKPIIPESVEGLKFDKVGDSYVASFVRENYRPAKALSFALPMLIDAPQVVMQSASGSRYFFASVAPKMKTRKKRWGNDLAIVWDVSLSGSERDLKRELEMLDIIFAEKKNADVYLYFLNNTLTKMKNKNTANGEHKVRNGDWNGLRNILKKAVFDGGTDFSRINVDAIAGDEILFFSDGISTLSDADFIKNTVITTKRPIHCVVSSAKADYGAMKLIAGKTMGKFINLNALSSERLKDELLNETLRFLGAQHGKAVREVYPSIATPVHGNFSLSGISDADNAEITLLFGFGNKVKKRFKVKLNAKNADEQGNVYKLWGQKKIAELDLSYKRDSVELTALGRQFGIITRNTSLIVLESVDDYIRYDITPPVSETKLYAEYMRAQKEMKKRNEESGDSGHTLLEKAVAAVDTIKEWWNTDFTPKFFGHIYSDSNSTRIYSDSDSTYYECFDSTGHRLVIALECGASFVCFDSAGRRSVVGIGCGSGYGSGFGGGGGGVDDLLGGQMGAGGGGIEIRHHGYLNVSGIDSPQDSAIAEEEERTIAPTITVKPIRNDNDYMKKLTGKTAEDYQTYLKVRKDYDNSPTFYFDMADWFFTHNDRKLALRVLTSIAELELEDASLYRLLGYRFKEYGEYALEKFVCQKVIQWRPMEPQSYRDYALALADNGEIQAALDSLYGLLTKTYSEDIINRSDGVEEIVVTEINRLIDKYANLNKTQIDKRLITDIPVDIRVVINWNMDNTDIDLHVKDPKNENSDYGHRETKIGGRISADNTSGYGPEQFLLRKAVKGKYKVSVNYFGDRQVTAAGPSTVMAEIFTKYAGKDEQRRVVSLQISKAKERDDRNGRDDNDDDDDRYIEVAEFEF